MKDKLGRSEDWWDGAEYGRKHSRPSQETDRRLTNLEQAVSGLPVFMQKATDKLDGLNVKADYTNGKVAGLVAWREQMKGAKDALGYVWAFLGVFFIAIIFGMFQMWVQFQGLDSMIEQSVTAQLDNYEFDILE